MNPDDHVCVCNRVSLRKLVAYMERTQPTVPSQLSECLGAGTGCHWCVPFLTRLFEQHQNGEEPSLPVSPEQYAKRRLQFHRSGQRDTDAAQGL
jgi:bacterioferritin-associated ferredoxin